MNGRVMYPNNAPVDTRELAQQRSPEELALQQRVYEQLMQEYTVPEEPSFGSVADAYKSKGLGEAAAEAGRLALSPVGKQLLSLPLASSSPEAASILYNMGAQEQKASDTKRAQLPQLRSDQTKQSLDYLKQAGAARKGERDFERDAKKADRDSLKRIPKQENVLRKEYDRYRRDFTKVKTAIGKVEASIKRKTAAGDVSAVFAYMKVLDPGSVVREGEQATARNAAGVPDRLRNAYNRAITGEALTKKQRNDFLGTAKEVFNSEVSEFNKIRGQYRDQSNRQGLDPLNVIGEDEDEVEFKETIKITPEALPNITKDETNKITKALETSGTNSLGKGFTFKGYKE
tara:strand:- start:3712 stop:4746 length:1035 start_codon:yes stop_codon:yes gene_type:complete